MKGYLYHLHVLNYCPLGFYINILVTVPSDFHQMFFVLVSIFKEFQTKLFIKSTGIGCSHCLLQRQNKRYKIFLSMDSGMKTVYSYGLNQKLSPKFTLEYYDKFPQKKLEFTVAEI